MAGATGEKDYLVIAGFEFILPDRSGDSFSVGDFGGKVLIAFPGPTHAQVSIIAVKVCKLVIIINHKMVEVKHEELN